MFSKYTYGFRRVLLVVNDRRVAPKRLPVTLRKTGAILRIEMICPTGLLRLPLPMAMRTWRIRDFWHRRHSPRVDKRRARAA